MNKTRVEAITDGIIAIAATIMVLELKSPSGDGIAGLFSLRHTFFCISEQLPHDLARLGHAS